MNHYFLRINLHFDISNKLFTCRETILLIEIFTSHKQYWFVLIFSRNPTLEIQGRVKWLANFQSRKWKKSFSAVFMLMLQWEMYFYYRWWLEDIYFFIKVYQFPVVSLKDVRIISTTRVQCWYQKKKFRSKCPKWSSCISYLLNFLCCF